MAAALLDLPKNAAYMQAVEITDMWLGQRDDGWLLMLKGRRRENRLVTFLFAPRFCDVLIMAATMTDSAHLAWRPDENPPKST